MGKIHVLLIVVAASPAAGCSLLFVHGPPDDYVKKPELTCSTSNAWPVVDTLLAGYQAVRTGYALSRSDSDYQGMQLTRGSDIGIGASLLVLTAVSAAVGYYAVSSCDEAHRVMESRHLRSTRPPPAFPVPVMPAPAPAPAVPGPPLGTTPPPPAVPAGSP